MKKQLKSFKALGMVALLGFAVSISGSAHAEMKVSTKGGLRVYDPCNNAFWFGLGGRLELDEVIFSGSHRDKLDNFRTSGNIRRGFLAFQGGIGDCWIYNVTLNFGRTQHIRNNTDNLTHTHGVTLIEEAWLGYTGLWDCTTLKVGQFTPFATMDGYPNYGLTNGQMFLESALATTAFSVPSYVDTDSRAMKGFGVLLHTQLCDMLTIGLTGYQAAHSPFNVWGNPRRSDRWGGAGRITFAPIHEEGCLFHLGVTGRYQKLNDTDNNAPASQGPGGTAVMNNLFFTTPEVIPRHYTGVFDASYFGNGLGNIPFHTAARTPVVLDIGPQRAKNFATIAGEAAAIWGPLTLQGEYHHARVKRVSVQPVVTIAGGAPFGAAAIPTRLVDGNLKFHGWHAQAGYVLTGESRGYDFEKGMITGVCPTCEYGAWEIALRYSYLTLNNKEVYGGKAHNITAGLNWFVNENVRFTFNYIRSNIRPTDVRTSAEGGFAGNTPPAGTPKRKLDIFGIRAQVVFF